MPVPRTLAEPSAIAAKSKLTRKTYREDLGESPGDIEYFTPCECNSFFNTVRFMRGRQVD